MSDWLALGETSLVADLSTEVILEETQYSKYGVIVVITCYQRTAL